MDTLIDLPPLPSTATSPPARKRRVSVVSSPVDADDDGETPPPAKKRAPRSSAAEKAAKKQARMERNRIAAQASRDRKRQQNEFLEARVAELEAQLQAANCHVSPSSSTPFSAPLSLVAPSTSFGDPQVAQLQEENEALKTQLALEKLQSQSLQIRLSALETKFGRLEQLLVKTAGGGEEASPQGVKAEPKEQHTMEQEQENEKEQEDTDNSRLPLLDPLSLPPSVDALPSLPSSDDPFAALLFPFADLDPTDSAPDPLGHQDPSVVSDDVLGQAWSDWATGLQLDGLEQQAEPAREQEFDFFEFLRQDAAAGSAAEVVC
ncbi:hypothetical protein JCM5296_004186 [Sporobolomyces johnsonii]